MIKILAATVLPGLALSGPALAEEHDLPPGHFPTLPARAAAAEGFAPNGWRVETRVAGDLNRDGRADLVLILRGQDPRLILAHTDNIGPDMVDSNPRILVVALAAPQGGYRLAAANRRVLPRLWNSSIADYLEGAAPTVTGGVLQLSLEVLSSGEVLSHTYRFRYRGNRLELIGYASGRAQRDTGEMRSVSIDYLSRRVTVSRGRIGRDTSDRTTTSRLPTRPRLTLDQLGDGLDFDPGVPGG